MPRRLAERHAGAIIALTIHSSDLDALQTIDPPLHELLRRPSDDLIMTPKRNPEEPRHASAAYPALADDEDLVRLPDLFAAVNLLQKLRGGSQGVGSRVVCRPGERCLCPETPGVGRGIQQRADGPGRGWPASLRATLAPGCLDSLGWQACPGGGCCRRACSVD